MHSNKRCLGYFFMGFLFGAICLNALITFIGSISSIFFIGLYCGTAFGMFVGSLLEF